MVDEEEDDEEIKVCLAQLRHPAPALDTAEIRVNPRVDREQEVGDALRSW